MVKSRLMKRTASFAVSAALLFSCIPAGAYAAEAGTADTNEINVKGIGTVYYEASADGNVTVNGAEQKATAIAGKNVQYYTAEQIPATLYGSASMTWDQFWAGEGVAATGNTTVNTNKDSVGEPDLGAYDAVSRATIEYGVSHSGYQFLLTLNGINENDGSEASANVAFDRDSSGNAVLRAEDSTPGVEPVYKTVTAHGSETTTMTGFKLNGKEYTTDNYDVLGFQRIPVSVSGQTYLEQMVLDAAGQSVPQAFKNVKIGGSDGAGETVTAATGGMKELKADGTYGKASAGVNTKSYTIVSGGEAEDAAVDYNTEWGDYADAYVYLQKQGDAAADTSKTTLEADEYTNYAVNFLAARYDYYGNTNPDKNPSAKPIASYGSKNAADTWWGPTKKSGGRIEVGFNFDAVRLGGTGKDTGANGIYNKTSAASKLGYWKITCYSAGYNDITKTFYLKDQYAAPTVSVSKDRKTISLGSVDSKLKAVLEAGTEVKIQKQDGRNKVDVATLQYAGNNSFTAIEAALDDGGDYVLSIAATSQYPAVSVSFKAEAAQAPAPASIKLSSAKTTIYTKTKKTVTLKATVTGSSKTATWKSSKPSVATVSAKGVVTAKKAGTTTITATANGVSAKCTVTVKAPTLKLAKTKATIKKGKSVTIKATATPAAKVTYKTSNKKVATVTSKGVVKGKKKGTAKITVTANGVKKTFTVTVK